MTTLTDAANAPLECDVCASCGALFDDQGGNGWWLAAGSWRHDCAPSHPARIVVRRLPQAAWRREAMLRKCILAGVLLTGVQGTAPQTPSGPAAAAPQKAEKNVSAPDLLTAAKTALERISPSSLSGAATSKSWRDG